MEWRKTRNDDNQRDVEAAAAAYRTAIIEKPDAGLNLQRMWHDLGRGIRLRRQLRIRETVRTDDRVAAPGRLRLSLVGNRGFDACRRERTISA